MNRNELCELVARNSPNPGAARRACLRSRGHLSQESYTDIVRIRPEYCGREWPDANYLVVTPDGRRFPIRAIDNASAIQHMDIIEVALADLPWFDKMEEREEEGIPCEGGPLFDSVLYRWNPETDEVEFIRGKPREPGGPLGPPRRGY